MNFCDDYKNHTNFKNPKALYENLVKTQKLDDLYDFFHSISDGTWGPLRYSFNKRERLKIKKIVSFINENINTNFSHKKFLEDMS